MLNTIWIAMIIIGIVYAAFTGRMEDITNSALSSAQEAVSLALSMAGIVAFWSGLMEIATASGVILRLTRAIRPILRFLFPTLKSEKAAGYIGANLISNILGLGWACTQTGLQAMEELAKENDHRPEASNDMCTFLVLNISSLQLIPVNMIAYRSQYGSASPSSIIAPSILATLISTIAAVIFIKIAGRSKPSG